MYRVVHEFYDLQDSCKYYLPGDTFPREGLSVGEERLEMLASDRTSLGVPVIEKVEEEKPALRKRVKKNAV